MANKRMTEIEIKNLDNTFTSYPIGVKSENIIFNTGIKDIDERYTFKDEVMLGCTPMDSGKSGLVPQPKTGDSTKALLGSGIWGYPNKAYSADYFNGGMSFLLGNIVVETPVVGEKIVLNFSFDELKKAGLALTDDLSDYAKKSIYDDTTLNLGRKANSINGQNSAVVGGENNEASSEHTIVVGGDNNTAADDNAAIVGGASNYVNGTRAAVIGGYGNTVSGANSVVIGGGGDTMGNEITGNYAVILGGQKNTVQGNYSAVIGSQYSKAEGDYSVVIGGGTSSSGLGNQSKGKASAVIGGYYNRVSSNNSVIIGGFSNQINDSSNDSVIIGGSGNKITTGTNSVILVGIGIEALSYQVVSGHYNNTSTATIGVASGTGTGTAFCIGNGVANSASNAIRFDYNGKLWCKQAYSSTGADYAELFEWEDENPNNEDRRGYFVTMIDNKIKKAQPWDWILGIVSANPAVLGNTDTEWQGQFLKDEFGAYIIKHYKDINPDTGEEFEYDFYEVNPDYDPNIPYIDRLSRPEWDAVGMMGVLAVYDDGTCEVNGFCQCANGGIATASESGYRVIERISPNIVKVVLK